MLASRGTPLLGSARVHASLPGLAAAWGGTKRHYAGILRTVEFVGVYYYGSNPSLTHLASSNRWGRRCTQNSGIRGCLYHSMAVQLYSVSG